MSLHPVTDVLLWMRWLAAAALVIGVPGHLVAGRHLHTQDALTRALLGSAVGLLLVPWIGTLCALAGLPFAWWTHLPIALVLGAALGRSVTYREMVASWSASIPPLDRRHLGVAACTVVLGAVLLVLGFGDFVAPPHVHDASNHAYLTLRTLQTSSLDPARLFADEAGQPAVLYLAGWHGAAGMIAQVGGVAPYVSTWMLALVAVLLIPVALSLVWRVWELPAWVLLSAMPLVAANQLVPGGVLGWGGFGQILGFFLVPPLVLMLRGLVRAPGWVPALWVGASLGALVQIHASEVVVVLLMLVPALGRRTDPERAIPWSRVVVVALVTLGAFTATAGPMVAELARAYAASPASADPGPARTVLDALRRFLDAGGKPLGATILFALGLLYSLRDRSTRPLGLFAWGLAGFYVALATSRAPWVLALGAPFYQQAPRVLYLQIFVAPALMVLPLGVLTRELRRRIAPRLARAVVAAVLLGVVGAAMPGVVTNYHNMRASVPFGPEAFRIAQQIPAHVGPGDVVANFWDDGSTWAMHVGERRFLLPCSWELFDAHGSLRPRVSSLLEEPWPAATLALRQAGVTHLWVSDERRSNDSATPSSRARLDRDPRFESVLRGDGVALYRIRWSADPATDGPS